eukprot:13673227-Alexandrium_andersonii.AAC.1
MCIRDSATSTGPACGVRRIRLGRRAATCAGGAPPGPPARAAFRVQARRPRAPARHGPRKG